MTDPQASGGQVSALWVREGQRYAMSLPYAANCVQVKDGFGLTVAECRRILLERVNHFDGAPPSSDYRRGDVLLVLAESSDGIQSLDSLLDTIGVLRRTVIGE